MEMLTAIALLCQIGTGSKNIDYIKRDQLKCQKQYIVCVNKGRSNIAKHILLEKYILDKKLKNRGE